MEADKWESFSEGTSDSEGYGDDPDDDDHCRAYASSDIPKLQFRYLAEIGALHLLSKDDMPLSLEHVYNKVAEGKVDVPWNIMKHIST
ncbi:hypothetical protein K7X08_002262 [Anisodus acutangulus]|uniref:Uncharacterized protein n=1 Tax=Anisodus acutangulus TaxID=402998 RepID=A0A9Q1R750_9SOLA|nr:hypothetical protein K7X08_002262 [Anisodus acutangulus]